MLLVTLADALQSAAKSKGKSASGKGKASLLSTEPGTNQTTLSSMFGVPAPSEKKNKKRKSTAAEDEAADGDAQPSVKTKLKANASTAGLGGTQKELPREGEEFEETQGVETQETQAVAPRRKDSSVIPEEEEDEDLAETQEATQVSTDPVS